MPTLYKPKKKPRKRINLNGSQKLYSRMSYRNLRAAYFMQHPLCELCLSQGITKPAQELHHIRRLSSGITDEEQLSLLADPDNVIALCTECHHQIHGLYNIGDYKEQETINKLINIKGQTNSESDI